jgi:hypothetical protein
MNVVSIEVLTAVTMKIAVASDVRPRSSVDILRLGGKCCLNLIFYSTKILFNDADCNYDWTATTSRMITVRP